ncbi:MAG: hypothetical protein IT462_12810 [Planctomycetes bacterium]|nr:hypothetical protein [Planctomycetota bacterium]
MKKLILAIALAGFFGAPAFAQETEGPGGEGEKEMSQQEMLAELHRLMAKASKEMESSETELAKASLPGSKADVLEARIKALREQMEKGEIKEIPEGLREYIKANPDKAAELSGKTVEEMKKLVQDDKEVDGLIKKSPEMLKKLAESKEAFEDILDRQYQAERKIEEVLKAQEKTIKAASENQDSAINLAHQLRDQGGGKGQPDKPDKNKSETKDPREKDQPKNGDPTKNAPKEYQPGEEKLRPDEKTEDFTNNENKEGFQADKKTKDLGGGAGNAENQGPGKYNGFWDKWREAMQKRNAEAAKTPK